MTDQVVEPKVPFLTRVFSACQGRHTALALGFFTTGNIFHYLGRLDATYIGFMTTLMGFVLGHSVKEDYFADKQAQK